MRQVNLTGRPPCSADPGRVEKLTGHLNARMAELIEDGLALSCRMENGVGRILIRFPHQENRQALRRLERYGISAAEEENSILFTVTGLVSHEDMDYVQGAVMEILYGE